MDNEKYGIELELITNKFKEKIEQVKSAFRGLTDKKINVNANTAQIEYLKQQIKEISALLDYNSKKPFMDYNEVLKNRAQLEKLTNQYNKLIAKQNEVASSSNKANLGISKSLDKMTSKIKRFGLSLLSIRSIWALVSRASSAYLAQDTELSNRLQSAWVGLGAMLAPIIETIVNLIAKAVKYINIFIKALTGVDLLAKASAKSMAGTAKSAKSLNKALAGFDELQNLDTDSGGGGTDLGGGLSGLEDVEIDTTWAERIKAFGEWIKENKDIVIGAFVGVASAILLIKSNFGLLKSLGIGIAITGIVMLIKDIIKFIKDPSWNNFSNVLRSLAVLLTGVAIAMIAVNLASPVGWIILAIAAVVALGSAIIKNWDKIKEVLGKVKDWVYERIIQPVGNFFSNLWNAIVNGIKTAIEKVKNVFNSVVNFFKNAINNVINLFKNIGIKVGEVIGSAFKSVINGVLRAIENILNSPIRAINRLIDIINAVPGINLGKLSTFNLPRLATGTNYVPEDQIAMIHKGEAVVPKKFNSKEYFGSGNEETNALLEEVIEAVRNIEINPYTTIRDVGKASLSYINNKSRQLGESVVV